MSEIVNKVVPIGCIHPHKRNYQEHPDSQIAQLGVSHVRFGQYRSVVLWDQGNGEYITVAGHGIIEAMRRNHVQEVRADCLPRETPQAEIDAILVADNLHAQNSATDETLLAELLQEQQDAGFDLASLGTDDETLRQMLETLGDEFGFGGGVSDGAGGDNYEVDADTLEVRCKRGDIWALGRHRRACGDCTDMTLVHRLMQSERAVCCWTDPPYGVSYVGKTKDALTIENDGREDIDAFLQRAFTSLNAVLQDGAAIYIAHPPGALSVTFGTRFLAQGWRLHETLIWVKDSMVLGHADYHYQHEPILFGYKATDGRRGRGGAGWYGDNSQTTVFEVARPKRSEEHPTMKPVDLIIPMLQNSSPRDGLVYDPFLGSGSTLIAGHRTGRKVYGCELDERYATVVLNRYEAESGQTATLLERAEEVVHA